MILTGHSFIEDNSSSLVTSDVFLQDVSHGNASGFISYNDRSENSDYRYRERWLYGFYRHKTWKQLIPILHKLHVDRDKVESL